MSVNSFVELTGVSATVCADIALYIVAGAVAVAICAKRIWLISNIYKENPPRVGHPALEAKQFQLFLKECSDQYNYNMLASLATCVSLTLYINLDRARAQAETHVALQALAVMGMASLLSGIFLSLLYMDVFAHVSRSYSNTVTWVQAAVATTGSRLGMAVILATPFASTASGIGAFIMFRVLSVVSSVMSAEHVVYRTTETTKQHIATATTAYVVVVAVMTAIVATSLWRTKTYGISISNH